VFQKKTRHYISDDNLNVNSLSTVIFGTLTAQSIGHWTVFLPCPSYLFNATVLFRKLFKPEN